MEWSRQDSHTWKPWSPLLSDFWGLLSVVRLHTKDSQFKVDASRVSGRCSVENPGLLNTNCLRVYFNSVRLFTNNSEFLPSALPMHASYSGSLQSWCGKPAHGVLDDLILLRQVSTGVPIESVQEKS